MEINTIDFLFQLAVLLFSAKMLGMLMTRLGLRVLKGGMIAGLYLGTARVSEWIGIMTRWSYALQENATLKVFAEVGVVFVMFTAGLETDLKEIKNTGLVSFLIALGGVILPLGLGFAVSMAFLGTENLFRSMFLFGSYFVTMVGLLV